MTGYQVPQDDTSMDFQYWLDYVADHQRYPVQPMQPCRTDDTEEYYHDTQSPTTLGLKALADTQHTADLAAGGFAAIVCGVQPQAAPPVPAFSEAPISITLKGLVHGVDTMVTIRGVDFATVQAQVEAASQWLDTPAVQPPAAQEPAHLCPIHGVSMAQQTNAKGSWWSHRLEQGQWCKGRKAA